MLTGVLYLLNLPALYVPLLVAHSLWRQDSSHIARMRRDEIIKDGFDHLPETHPLYQMVKKQADAVNVGIIDVYLDSRQKGLYQAYVTDWGARKAVFYFRGDPMGQPGGDRVMNGVIAHEIAHVQRHTSEKVEAFSITGMFYISFGIFLLLLGVPTAQPSVILAGMLCLVLGGGAMPSLKQAYRRTDETLTDITGAQSLGDPKAVIETLSHIRAFKEQMDFSQFPASELETSSGKCLRLCFGRTHPWTSERIETVRAVFNMAAAPEDPPIALPPPSLDGHKTGDKPGPCP